MSPATSTAQGDVPCGGGGERLPRGEAAGNLEQVFGSLMAASKDEHPFTGNFLSDPAAGLVEFIKPDTSGFHGKLKSFPEDFVVTEINSGGELVVLDNYETPEERGCDSLAQVTRKRKLKEGYMPPVKMTESVPLQELISSEQYLLLEQLATSYKQMLEPDPSQHIDLGKCM